MNPLFSLDGECSSEQSPTWKLTPLFWIRQKREMFLLAQSVNLEANIRVRKYHLLPKTFFDPDRLLTHSLEDEESLALKSQPQVPETVDEADSQLNNIPVWRREKGAYELHKHHQRRLLKGLQWLLNNRRLDPVILRRFEIVVSDERNSAKDFNVRHPPQLPNS